MELRLLYFESCPGWQQTQKHLEEVLEELSLDASYEALNVTEDMPQLPKAFYGSPTIAYKKQKSGEWEELFGMTGEPVMACRTYNHDGKIVPYIPQDMLKSQLTKLCPDQIKSKNT